MASSTTMRTCSRRMVACIGTQRKLHLFSSEEGWLAPGDELHVFDLPFGCVAMPICMDLYLLGDRAVGVPGGRGNPD